MAKKKVLTLELEDAEWYALLDVANGLGKRPADVATTILREGIGVTGERMENPTPALLLYLIHAKAKNLLVVKEQLVDLAVMALSRNDEKQYDMVEGLCIKNGIDADEIHTLAESRFATAANSIFETSSPDPVIRAKRMISDILSKGEDVLSTVIIQQLVSNDISEGAWKVAKQQLAVKSIRKGKAWYWRMTPILDFQPVRVEG